MGIIVPHIDEVTHPSASPKRRSREVFTPEQRNTLIAVRDLRREYGGIPPTYVEVAAALGVSKSTARQTILRLKRKGLLESEARRNRNLKLTVSGHRAIRKPERK